MFSLYNECDQCATAGLVHLTVGRVHLELAGFCKALEAFQRAHKIAHSIQDPSLELQVNNIFILCCYICLFVFFYSVSFILFLYSLFAFRFVISLFLIIYPKWNNKYIGNFQVYVGLSELFCRLQDADKSSRYAARAYDLSRSLQLGDLNSRHHRAALLQMAAALRKKGELGDAHDYCSVGQYPN